MAGIWADGITGITWWLIGWYSVGCQPGLEGWWQLHTHAWRLVKIWLEGSAAPGPSPCYVVLRAFHLVPLSTWLAGHIALKLRAPETKPEPPVLQGQWLGLAVCHTYYPLLVPAVSNQSYSRRGEWTPSLNGRSDQNLCPF